jgi:hypothetical protein
MPQAKQTSKLKRRSKALPVLGAAGLSLSLASAASAVPSGLGDMPTPKTGTDNAFRERSIFRQSWARDSPLAPATSQGQAFNPTCSSLGLGSSVTTGD